MVHVPCSVFRHNLAAYLNHVCDDKTPVFVTRSNGRSTAVLISEDEYKGLMEALHLLKSPTNASRLIAAIQSLNGRKLKTKPKPIRPIHRR